MSPFDFHNLAESQIFRVLLARILILRLNSSRSCFTWKQSILGGFGAYFLPFDRTLSSWWESSTSDRFMTVLGGGLVSVVGGALVQGRWSLWCHYNVTWCHYDVPWCHYDVIM